MGMGEKKNEIYKNEYENQGKIPRLVAIPPVYEMEADCPKTPKTSGTYPRWERDPCLVG